MRSLFSVAVLALITLSFSLDAQDLNNVRESQLIRESSRKIIQIPDIQGYQTLKCDFHTHTVFSDGCVWPTVRVTEAWQEGLDAIAITDHLEYLPHREYVKGDHNTSYEIARPLAEKLDLILIRGGEITREMPPGHLNGLFLEDVNALDTSNVEDALQAVVDQGGFVMWNHPGWKAQQHDTCKWMDMHQDLFEKGLIHGIEVFNSAEWYPVAIDWCREKDLTMLGNSDIHYVTSHHYDLENGHRPITLVFAEDRSPESIRRALFARRSVAWFGDKMIGPKNILDQLFQASLEIEKMVDSDKETILKVKNLADVPFHLSDGNGFEKIIPRLSEAMLSLPDESGRFKVTNLIIGSEEVLETTISF